ncbi:hypothetical protein VNO78_34384 [Psophocarpus tetragonolobus]|uniref:Uncharacterized protein n=1 Tax=Psophocarpus tetragonolobus TaxID=3891 RepID=A0AAN9NUR5_PSOTE
MIRFNFILEEIQHSLSIIFLFVCCRCVVVFWIIASLLGSRILTQVDFNIFCICLNCGYVPTGVAQILSG